MSIELSVMYLLSSYGLRAIFISNIVYTSCNLDLMQDFQFCLASTACKRYRLCYDVIFDAFDDFFVSFLPSTHKTYIFALNPMKL